MRQLGEQQYRSRMLVQAFPQVLVEGFDAFLGGKPMTANSHDSYKAPAVYAAWRTCWLEAGAALGSADPVDMLQVPMSRPSVK